MMTTDTVTAPVTALTWSLASTHCPWCARRVATPDDWDRHVADFDETGVACEDHHDRWCAELCWTGCIDFVSPVTLIVKLRARNEVHDAVLAWYRDGWVENYRRNQPEGRWWNPRTGKTEPMSDAQQVVLYGRVVARPRRWWAWR